MVDEKVTRIAVLYGLIALLATAVNIGVQAAVVHLYQGGGYLQLSVLAGTAVGLPIKYMLEKKFIFLFTADSIAHDTRLFVIYSFLGIFTTALFWGIEYLFHVVFGTDAMRYTGAAIGLTLGYVIKYHMDKHWVFRPGASA
ncbi:MAG: GtrA family protein [Limnohabitans sp.]